MTMYCVSKYEKQLLKRMYHDTLARSCRYHPHFYSDARIRAEAERASFLAIEDAEATIHGSGELMFVWPELTTGWIASFFGLLNYGINVGWPSSKITDLFPRHDQIGDLIRPIDRNSMTLTKMNQVGPGTNPYAAEFLSTLAINRENTGSARLPRQAKLDIEKANSYIVDAMNAMDPDNHAGDSIRGGLLLARMEAQLLRFQESMPINERVDYEIARQQADRIFSTLGMPRKMHRIQKLERSVIAFPEQFFSRPTDASGQSTARKPVS